MTLKFVSGRAVHIVAREVEAAPFEAFSLDVDSETPVDLPANHGEARISPWEARVTRVEIFRRVEWKDVQTKIVDAAGAEPFSVDTGPVGAAPARAESVIVNCGIALFCDHAGPVLCYLLDTPGVLDITMSVHEIDTYRERVSAEVVLAPTTR